MVRKEINQSRMKRVIEANLHLGFIEGKMNTNNSNTFKKKRQHICCLLTLYP